MMRGDVVILEVLFSDRQGSKVRPALVVQSDFLNERLPDTIVAIITSSPRRFTGSGTQLQIDPASAAGKSSGLRALSVVQCENLVTVDTSLIHAKIGRLSESLMLDADKCLKFTLGIR
jgi:mRNA-degrading endonuclease toxin of MazEF toxin-antitoxin module